jgi:hypothetical protein
MFDYLVDNNENFTINKANRQTLKSARVNRFNKLQNTSRITKARNSIPTRMYEDKAFNTFKGAMDTGTALSHFGRAASRLAAPLAILATTMEIGQTAVDFSYNRTEAQSFVRGGIDLVTEEAPTIISMAAFGAVENKISGKFSGNAGSFLQKRFKGIGGGAKGKAISMVGAYASYAIMNTVLSPVKKSISNYISGARSGGLMSSIVKGETGQAEASIRQMAGKKGFDTEFGAAEFAKGLKAPSSLQKFNTGQINTARSELTSDVKKGEQGFWSALFSGEVNKWTEEFANRSALEDVKAELTRRYVEFSNNQADNNKQIIDFYSRE